MCKNEKISVVSVFGGQRNMISPQTLLTIYLQNWLLFILNNQEGISQWTKKG